MFSMYDVNIRGSWICLFGNSSMFVQLFCKSEIISKKRAKFQNPKKKRENTGSYVCFLPPVSLPKALASINLRDVYPRPAFKSPLSFPP